MAGEILVLFIFIIVFGIGYMIGKIVTKIVAQHSDLDPTNDYLIVN